MPKLGSNNESDLVKKLSHGDFEAYELLFERYGSKLYRFVFSYLKSDVDSEDLVQEVFMKLWENKENLKSNKSFQSYLFTIAFNSIKQRFNLKIRKDKFKHDLIEWFSQEQPSLESRKDFEILLDKLDQLIDQLPEKRKKVFILRKKEGKSIEEIANELEISPKTVKNQITEAMKFFKKSFKEDNISSALFYFLFIS